MQPYDLTVSSVNCETLGNKIALDQMLTDKRSVGFSRQEYGSGLSFPPLGDLPDTGIESESPALQADSLLLSHWGSLQYKLSKPRWRCC